MITVESLTKKYGSGVPAVDDVSFTAATGRVTGFLGPNGAGKSTTMRIMVGLTPADLGHRHDRRRALRRPAQPGHPGRCPARRLGAARRPHRPRDPHPGPATMGLPRARVDEMLDLVSLTEDGGRPPGANYSLGMRQRLGIGTALLGDPHVLILDEPANGLDPAGIRWMRDLLRGFADQGGTVLLSSHLLHEIEVIADDIVVIGNGRIVARGHQGRAARRRRHGRSRRRPPAWPRPSSAGSRRGPCRRRGLHTDATAAHVGEVALAARVALTELRAADGAGLEEMFLELTADTQREGAAA